VVLKEKIAQSGNYGGRIRSDCQITLEAAMSGGIQIKLNSRVKSMYGKAITHLIQDLAKYFGFTHLHVSVLDAGALPFVMAARMEAAIKTMIETKLDYLPEKSISLENSTKDRFRFSRLYLPGNTPSLMLNAGLHKPNGLILDLEDSVSYDRKHEARFLVRNALRELDFNGAEKMVRINQIPNGLDDLNFIVSHGVQLILVPKCEHPDQILAVNQRIEEILKIAKQDRKIWLMPIIESALGVVNAYPIASSAENIAAMAIGLEDYTADIGCQRTNAGQESFFARNALVNACKAAGIQAIDSVFSDTSDMQALKENVAISKSLGFDGMGCIHPRQIGIIHGGFAPDTVEIEKAQRIVMAFEFAQKQGLGVVSLGSKMIDAPVVKRAEKTVKLALDLELISKDWRNQND